MEITDEQILEDILALDELSKKTLGSYINKAVSRVITDTSYLPSIRAKHKKDAMNKIAKRTNNITKATDRLTKEQKETIENVLEELEDDQIVEDLLALDELSPTTLNRYIDKATDDFKDKHQIKYRIEKNPKFYGGDNKEEQLKRIKHGIKKRIQGVGRADNRLTKMQKETIESVIGELENDTINELSKKTLGSYLSKARKEIPSLHKKFDDDHEAYKKKSSGYYKDNGSEKMDKSFSKINGRLKGVSTANNKIKEEEMDITDEQIVEDILALDELSKKTLGSYMHKAIKDFSFAKYYAGNEQGRGARKVGEKSDATIAAAKRLKGITRATNRLTKEQKETIEGILEELEEETTISEASSQLINNIISGDSMEIENSFESIMKEKIADRLDSFRKEIAQGMFKESVELDEEQIVEDILALDELSKETLSNYLNKSVFNHTKNTSRSFTQKNNADKKRAIKNRVLGITRASGKLTKEQKETIESVLEEDK